MKLVCGNIITVTAAVVMTLLLVACGIMNRLETGEAVAYKDVEIRPPLSVPEGLNSVPLNPANELQQNSSGNQIDDSRVPPSAGLDQKTEIELDVGASPQEPEVSAVEPEITVVVTGRNPRLNTSHPVHIVWQSVGLTLQRLNIPVTDLDRNSGVYFVDCLAASGEEIKKKRWWNILSKDESIDAAVCELSIAEENESIGVRIAASADGVPSEQQIVDLLEELKLDLDRV